MATPRAAPERFVLEDCAWCKGGTLSILRPVCPACQGKAQIRVYAPPLTCQRCGGSGHSTEVDLLTSLTLGLCIICRGTGWVMTEFHIETESE